MKIVHITSAPAAGGAEIYVKDLSIGMAKKGHHVTILFISHAEEIQRSVDFEENYLRELRENDINYLFIGNSCKKNVFKGVFVTTRIINKLKPDVIHSHLYYGAIFSLLSVSGKKIYTHHNIKLKASKYIYKILDLGGCSYIGICQACTDLLKKCTKKDVIKINNGVDTRRLFIKENYSKREIVNVLMAGRLTEQKNYKLILKAISGLQDKSFHLYIAGEGEERDELEKYSMQLGISGIVTFLGNRKDVNQLMYDADVFAMCSSWEGLPISLIEATLTGLPLIVTDVGGCREIVESVGNGIIVKNLEINEYREALNRIITSYRLRHEFHNNAVRYGEMYTIDFTVNSHIDVYTKIIK